MKIQWLGHACFLLTSSSGVRVLTDPFDPSVGYPVPSVEADIVTTSHQHSDHNYTQAVKGAFQLINSAGSYSVKGIDVLGVDTFHDDAGGAKRGKNLIFRFTIDGLTVAHCGDLGHPLSPEQAQAVGPVDVLIVPVGGYYTIDALTAKGVAEQLKARLTVPMHFKTPVMDFPITTVDPFIEAMGGAQRAGTTEIEVTRASLPAQAGVIVLDFPKG